MATDVDLRDLAVKRETPAGQRVVSRRHVLARYVLPVVLIAGFLAVVGWTAQDALLPRTPVTVVPVHVARAEMQQAGTPLFKAAGWIEPRPRQVAVAALAPGVVDDLLVVEDQQVKAGDPVALLVADDARLVLKACVADVKLRTAELKLAEATRDAAKVRLDQPVHLDAQLAEARAKLAAAETKLADLPYQRRSAEAQRRFAQGDYDGKARAGDAVAGRILEQSRSALDTATALVEQLERQEVSLAAEISALTQRYDALKVQRELATEESRQYEEARAKVTAAEARIEQADVARAEAELQLERMTVRAPVDGRIYRLWGSRGTRLVPGMSADEDRDGSTVVTMYQPEKLQVRVDVRFDDLPQVLPGQPVLIESPAVGKPLEGEVLFLSSLADIQKNTLEVKVAIDSPPEVFKPEMLVDVTFLAPEMPESETAAAEVEQLYVPKQLVEQDEDGSFVWIADQRDRVARRVAITTGRRGNSRLIEVASGLSMADKLIANAPADLRDGQRIEITGEDTALGTEAEEETP